MSEELSFTLPRVRTSEDKLYQACLSACIEGIVKLPVSRRTSSSATVSPHNNNPTVVKLNHNTTIERASNIPSSLEPESSLLSPPPSPLQSSSPPPSSPATMDRRTLDRTPLHGAPSVPPHTRGATRPVFGNQDARISSSQDPRSNFAVQPADNAGSLKLKKKAVKIVGAAGPAPSTPPSVPRAPAPSSLRTTPAVSSPVAGPVKAEPKEVEHVEPAKRAPKFSAPTTLSQLEPSKIEPPRKDAGAESDLDAIFSRLTTQTTPTPVATSTSKPVKEAPPAGPDRSMFSFDNEPTTGTAWRGASSHVATSPAPPVLATMGATETTEKSVGMSQEELEHQYLRKAAEYLSALPNSKNVSVQTIKTVAAKLRGSYTLDGKLTAGEVEKLKARYAFAVVNYINQVVKKSAKPLTADFVKKILQDNDGNILALYAALVEGQYLTLENLDQVAGLCKTILDILPKSEPTVPTSQTASKNTTETKPVSTAPIENKPLAKDPMDSVKAWPTQEKRETPATYRACILKGVSGITSVNRLQALVWGGRLESIQLPEVGSGYAVVRFLTPEACDTYIKATENGIEVGDEKKTVVFVEKQPGPTSTNDVIRNCIEGDASRCVRAVDAEDDWSEQILLKLARGKGAVKREVDRIKTGKNARGRYYIEFRFANIYHALNFKSQLKDEPDWEHCTIIYAKDPCETARGVHYKDEGEEAVGFFA